MDPSPICARRCVKRLARRLAQIEHRIEVGSAASASRRCRRALRAATRTARVLDRRATKLTAGGRIASAARGTRLQNEATRLRARADVLSRTFCIGR